MQTWRRLMRFSEAVSGLSRRRIEMSDQCWTHCSHQYDTNGRETEANLGIPYVNFNSIYVLFFKWYAGNQELTSCFSKWAWKGTSLTCKGSSMITGAQFAVETYKSLYLTIDYISLLILTVVGYQRKVRELYAWSIEDVRCSVQNDRTLSIQWGNNLIKLKINIVLNVQLKLCEQLKITKFSISQNIEHCAKEISTNQSCSINTWLSFFLCTNFEQSDFFLLIWKLQIYLVCKQKLAFCLSLRLQRDCSVFLRNGTEFAQSKYRFQSKYNLLSSLADLKMSLTLFS